MLVDLKKTTLVDYPNHLASTLYTRGCNFLCPFCHNKSLITIGHEGLSDSLSVQDWTLLDMLKARAHLIQGVVITGGEPTMHPALFQLTEQLHRMGLKVKLDTNGCQPKILRRLIEEGLIDYIAMDVKDALPHYEHSVGKHIPIERIDESIHIIQDAFASRTIDAEFRTTLVQPLHTIDTLHAIAQTIEGPIPWYLQRYEYSTEQLSATPFQPMDKEQILPHIEALKSCTPNLQFRGYS